MLKSALKTDLATELDDPTNDDLLDLLGQWIDDIIQNIAIRRGLDILNITSEVTLNSGDATVNVPGIVNIKQIQRGDNHTILPKRDQPILMAEMVDLDVVAPPNYWFIKEYGENGIVVQLDRTADTDYTLIVNGTKDITTPIDDASHLPFPDLATNIIKTGVRYYFYLHENQYQSAQVHKADYEHMISLYLRTHGGMYANRTISPQNSDMKFTNRSRRNFLDDVFQGRQIPDPDDV